MTVSQDLAGQNWGGYGCASQGTGKGLTRPKGFLSSLREDRLGMSRKGCRLATGPQIPDSYILTDSQGIVRENTRKEGSRYGRRAVV